MHSVAIPESAVLYAPSLEFELQRIEGGLQEMYRTPVASDHQLPIGPLGIFASADPEFEGEPFENEIAGDLEFVI